MLVLIIAGETMEFHHLRSFVVVAQTGNVTKAAKQLYTTPPAVSAHLKSLEDELNTQLFMRSSKGMTLTDKGRILLPKAEKTLSSALDFVNHAASQQNELIGSIRLGINQPSNLLSLDRTLKELAKLAPGIDTEIVYGSSGDLIEKLIKDQLDITYAYGEIPNELVARSIKTQELIVVAPNKFNLNKDSDKPDLQGLPWIDVGINCPFTSLTKKYFGKNIEIVTSAADDATRLSLVKAGLGLSFIEKDIAQSIENITCLPQFTIEAELKLIYKREREGSPLIKAFLTCI